MGNKLQLCFSLFSCICMIIFMVKLRLNPGGSVYKNGFQYLRGRREKKKKQNKKKLLRILCCRCANQRILKLKPAKKGDVKTCKSTCTHSNGADAHQTEACKTAEVEQRCLRSAFLCLLPTWKSDAAKAKTLVALEAAETGHSQLATG